ncbi:MAG TPA: DUF3455 domain-containing protein [Chitinophagaceae bacterium]|nr:DUF3455 domain-containing protein [Chitinophagaceae bacterium]
MKKVQFRKFIFITTVSSVMVVACSRDNDVDVNSPAVKIAESETLSIPPAVDLPSNLPNGNTRVATFYAKGVQKYKAKLIAGTNPAQYEWLFVAPLAALFNAGNAKVGTHSAGPTWQLLGSTTDSIYAQAFTPAKSAPSSDPRSIDWLQLMPKTGKTPTGIFTGVSYIQRIATSGGKAPLAAPVNATDTIDVPYTAVYRFTKKNP